jgi:hypothetical protein
MRHISLTAALAAVVAAFVVSPAGAITGGTIDGTTHPEVGAMLADFGDGLDVLCTGTLISSRVFLSAGHCTDYLTSIGVAPHDVYVTLDPSWRPGSPGTAYRGTYYTDPQYGYSGMGGQSDPHDIAVIVLDKAIKGVTPAKLPSSGLLDRLPLKSARFTAVGYGTVRDVKTTGPNAFYFDGIRRWVDQGFYSLEPAWLNLNMNFSTGNGGTCYGDSGGPHFYGDASSNRLVATTITGDYVCVSTDKDYRLDTAPAMNFLAPFATYGAYSYWG